MNREAIEWYISRDGRNFGPYTDEQMQAFIQEGRVASGDLLWNRELPDWTPAWKVPGLIVQAKEKVPTGGKLSDKRKQFYLAFTLAILCMGFLVFLVVGNLLDKGSKDIGRTGEIKLEDPVYRGTTGVEPSGGTLRIEKPESSISGFEIDVSEGAYPHAVDFAVHETAIESHTFGDDFNPVTPLITVENGGVWADIPVEVTVPIEKQDDELALGFYYDRELGTLEAIPFLDQTNK